MPGVKGMVSRRPRVGAVRQKIWQSMRVHIRFTTPDLCRSSGAAINNTRKFIRRLEAHGYVAKLDGYISGRSGSYQGYRLVRGIDRPYYPTRCERCGQPLGDPCEPGKEKHDEG
jgi:hypothetical protein